MVGVPGEELNEAIYLEGIRNHVNWILTVILAIV